MASESGSVASVDGKGRHTAVGTSSLRGRVRALLAAHGGSAANALLAAFAQGQSGVAAFLMGDLEDGDGPAYAEPQILPLPSPLLVW